MLEKLKKIFNEKNDKKKTENLIAFLIILVVTLIIMNKILKSDSGSKEEMYQNQTGVQLVSSKSENAVLVNNQEDSNLEKSLEDILSKINGVGNVQVLVTYKKDDPLKIEGVIVIATGARKYRNKEKYYFCSRSCDSGL